MHIILISPYLAGTKCLWQQTTSTAMGGQNCCIGPASVSFSIHLNMRWRGVAAKTHTACAHGRLGVLMSLGGVRLPLTGLRALTDPNTLFQRRWHIFTEDGIQAFESVSARNEKWSDPRPGLLYLIVSYSVRQHGTDSEGCV